jgi:hypothetical protein
MRLAVGAAVSAAIVLVGMLGGPLVPVLLGAGLAGAWCGWGTGR